MARQPESRAAAQRKPQRAASGATSAPAIHASLSASLISLQASVGNHATAQLIGESANQNMVERIAQHRRAADSGAAAGNTAVARLLAQRKADDNSPSLAGMISGAIAVGAAAVGVGPIELHGSVGRGGRNEPADVQLVRSRLDNVGYSAGASRAELGDAIERYQAEVVGLRRPDGRIDVGAGTLAALRALKRTRTIATPAPSIPSTATPHGAATTPGQAAAPVAPGAAQPTAAPAVAAGDLGELVATAHNPLVDAAAAKLLDLEQRSKAAKIGHTDTDRGEELGTARDELVAGIFELRGMISGLASAGLPEPQLKALQAALYRGINAVSPYYFQHNNVVLEYSTARKQKIDKYNTCNVTSLAMALEALGKTAADYDQPERLAPVLKYLQNDLAQAGDVTSAGLTGYRLPDVLAMIAIVEKLGGNMDPTLAQFNAAGNAAFEWVPKLDHVQMIADHFKVNTKMDFYQYKALAEYGGEHWKAAKAKGDARKAGQATSTSGLSDPDVESKIALAPYKRDLLRKFQPILDSGKQVVVGQWNHFVRLQALDDKGVVLDDPGWWNRANVRQTWEEARALGLFENYLVLG